MIEQVKHRFSRTGDLFGQRVVIRDASLFVCGLRSLIDFPQSVDLLRMQSLGTAESGPSVMDALLGLGYELKPDDEDKACAEILNGMLVVIDEGSNRCLCLYPIRNQLSRSLSTPLMENNIRGSGTSFNEDIDTNIGLLRKQFNTHDLGLTTYTFGSTVKSRVIVSYMKGSVEPKMLQALTEKLESQLNQGVANLQDLSNILKFPKLSLVSRYNATELPQNASRALRSGKIVLFVERFPFALVVPSLITDMLVTEDDMNHPAVYMFLFRAIRLIGLITTLIFPGLYVALVSVNPDVLQFELAHSIAMSRLDVPYPAIVETLILLFVLELIMEAIIRLPSSIGPTVTMVGGIVLGQAVVTAKLVSNLLIIVLAAVTIANATVVGYQNSLTIRLFKYLLLFLSTIFGVLGLLSGLVIIVAYLSSVRTLDVPYLQLKPKGD
ncbi:spore germination protein [Paenibacillus sp. R14(2021)]|uniref:spore germination protein n=1 Tax=Paenibacillus sp. R14(2021) TaxID=2859228 RepID=UPI001C615B9C|nr:spore germination protein [Paenibacillus sp. R14(2021)]